MEIIKIRKKDRETNIKLKQLNVAAYIRVSTEAEKQKSSFESQQLYYRDKITKNSNWNLVDIYSDYGISGTNSEKREEFNRMFEDAINGKIDLILTKSVSRFARNTVDTLKFVRLLKERNVGILFEEENIFSLNMENEILISVLASIAQKESELCSARIKFARKIHYENGEPLFNASCYGYTYDKESKKLIINSYEAEAIKIIFNKYLAGETQVKIAGYLNEHGYRTKFNKFFGNNTVSRILKNIIYTGDIIKGKYIKDPVSKRIRFNNGEENKYLIKNSHEAIISREEFEKVQEMLARKRDMFHDSNKYKAVDMNLRLSGMVRCGFCREPYKYKNLKYRTKML